MQGQDLMPIGKWRPDSTPPAFSTHEIFSTIPRVRQPLHVVRESSGGRLGLGQSGEVLPLQQSGNSAYPLMATFPALYPEWLGDRSFLEVHHLRFPYVAGAMFRGIASSSMVIEMARAGMIGFFGAGGMALNELEKALEEIEGGLGNSGLSWGSNLLHSPSDSEMEDATVDLYLRRGVKRVSAAAYMSISRSVVRYAATGLRSDSSGHVSRHNYLFAKVSRPEVARLFMCPAPKEILESLVSQGRLTKLEATLASRVPLAEDITVEGDSGGHTDNQTLTSLFPTVLSLRDEMVDRYGYARPIRIGAAGGLGTPSAVAAAFAMGAAYVLTGSVNQGAVESGLSAEGREMLAMADVSDVAMAPAADMFELGAKVQVLKRGTMFSNRASQIYQIYSAYSSLESIPSPIRAKLEKDIFCAPMEEIWTETRRFFSHRAPKEIEKAEKDPKHRMALVFRWYLGKTAQWAIDGDSANRINYQICCGPAMGSFNAWVAGSFLERPENRTVVNIARNLLEGAAVVTRAQQLRSYGVPVPSQAFFFRPRNLS